MRLLFLFAALALSVGEAVAQQARYVFLFIGDGMGAGAVTLTEAYLAAKEGSKVGSKSLAFSALPVAGMMTTYSANNLTTCSAASATAFACGQKTNNDMLGVTPDGKPLTSIASRLKARGFKVGITTSVSVDHATPAGFYAHQPRRGMYYEIACELPQSGFDFFAGAGFVKPTGNDGKQENVIAVAEKNGYAVVRSLAACTASAAPKIILIQPESKNQKDFPYVLDKTDDDYTLAQITTIAIDKLLNPKGFFLLVEGGKVDWASHDNDAGAMVGEVVDMDNAVVVALDFYKKYPKQTLIVVTADHETGGLGVGYSGSSDIVALTRHTASVTRLHALLADTVSFAELRTWLADSMSYAPNYTDELTLRQLFAQHASSTPRNDRSRRMLNRSRELGNSIVRMVSAAHGATYSTYNHTGTMVPVFAIGAGSELFTGKIDNSDIPKKIAKATGTEWK
ncbi:MAG: alkaline phosphatase [Prevotellaceae bacterium]|jgi:alkaline phosphatase|nr:alkaline phosphatase [Prevotellaceae bacterium]